MAASEYSLEYVPLTGSWDAKRLREVLTEVDGLKRANLGNPSGVRGLEKYLPGIGNFTREQAETARDSLSRRIFEDISKYVGKNAKEIIKGAGNGSAVPVILQYAPAMKRESKDGSNEKYNEAIDAISRARVITRGVQEDKEEALGEELAGLSDIVKSFWINNLGKGIILQHRQTKAYTAAAERIMKYGESEMVSEMLTESSNKEKEFAQKSQELHQRIEDKLQSKRKELGREGLGIGLSLAESAKIQEEFAEQERNLNEAYAPYLNVKEIITDPEVGLITLALNHLTREEDEKKKAA